MSQVLPDLIPPLQSVLNGRFAAVPKSLGRPFKASMTTPEASSRNSAMLARRTTATHARRSEARLARRLEGPESLRMSQVLPDLIPPLQSVLNGRFAAVPKSLGRPFKTSMTTPEASSRNSAMRARRTTATHARRSEARLARRLEGPESLPMSQVLPDLIPPLQSVLNGRFAAVPKSLGRPFKTSMTTPEASSRNSAMRARRTTATHARRSEARLARLSQHQQRQIVASLPAAQHLHLVEHAGDATSLADRSGWPRSSLSRRASPNSSLPGVSLR